MRILLNGQEIDAAASDDVTLGTALLNVQEQNLAQDEVISAIWVDDEPLTAERLSIWKDKPVSEFAETRIEAPPRNTLASKGLRMISQGLAKSESQREQIVEDVCQGRLGQAMEKLTSYLEIWKALEQTVGSVCRLLDVDLEQDAADQQSESIQMVQKRLDELTKQLAELKSALEASDLVLVGDILDYEFGDISKQWCEVLESLADELDNSS